MQIVGIDPGLKGALAFIDCRAMTLRTEALPIYRRNDKSYLDATAIAQLLRENRSTHAFIEDVFSSPQMGVVSAFTFGEGKGVLRGVIGALGITEQLVSPARWKADLRTSADKDHTKALARRLFPQCAKPLSSEGKCEAALIGLWGCLSLNLALLNVQPAV